MSSHLGKMHAREAMKTRRPVKPSKSFVKSYFMAFDNDPIKHYFVQNQSEDQKQEVNGVSDTESFARYV